MDPKNSNFLFLREGWPDVFRSALEAERHVLHAPVTSSFYSRLTLEQVIDWMYAHDPDLKPPYQSNLAARMMEQSFRDNLPPAIYSEIDYIRRNGNVAIHKGKASAHEAIASLKYLHRFCQWLAKVYSAVVPELPQFDENLLPQVGAPEQRPEQLRSLQTQLEENIRSLEEERKRRIEVEAELEKFKKRQAETKALKEQHKFITLPPEPFDEAQTRRLLIDIMLKEAGWDPSGPNVAEYPVEGIPAAASPNGRGRADYVLWGKDGLPLAVIEAKRTSSDPQQGQHQALIYADCLEKMHGRRPVIFFSNGYQTWLWDDLFYPPREVQGYYTRDELELLIDRRRTRIDLRLFNANPDIAGRYYQIEAVQRVAETYAIDGEHETLKGGKRAALLVMATGAGKTRTAAAIVDMLIKCNWVKRVLFLADRNNLVTQAQNAFKIYLPHLSSIDLTKDKEDDTTRLVFSTYPTIMNRIDSARTGDERFYGVGHFDLVILDEAHRSVYQKYQAIFRYFDALLLGLTATPRDEADRDTYRLFDCDPHNPTSYYELDQAVADHFLVPPKGKEINLGFLRRGIHYDDLTEEEKAEYEVTFRDEEGNLPSEINAEAINEWLFNKDTIDKVLDYLMQEGIKIEGGEKLGKTIIFARNHKHALEIQKRFDHQYPQYSGKFCRVIDHKTKHAEQAIEDFKNPEKYPQIAVSVDMLDTGIDIPEVLNLLFFKPVYSASKFWQMIGRGTRLCPDLISPGEDKPHFYIFDFCGNFEFFDFNPDGLVANVPISLSQRLFQAKLELAQLIRQKRATEHDDFRHQLLDWCYEAVMRLFSMRENFRIRQVLEYIDRYRDRNRWSMLSRQDVSEILQHLAPLVHIEDPDEQAKRFDLVVVQLQIAQLAEDVALQPGIDRVKNLARILQDLGNVPAVRAKMQLIRQVQQDTYWQSAGLEHMEALRLDIRSLIRLIPKKEVKTYTTNFTDYFEGTRDVDVLPPYVRMESYKQRVERFIRENTHHLTIHKLRNNQPITSGELEELERILFDGHERGTRADYEKEYGDKPLGVFIRSIIGLDINAAKNAFAEFLNRSNLRADQITFINYIIEHLAHNGIIEKRMLVSKPFTDIHDLGIFGLFDEQDQARVVHIIEGINRNARVG